MWDWLISPIDPTRAHEVGFAISWHARFMVLGWAILAPTAVLIARFFKVMPGQDYPRVLDSKVWWRSHWMGQSVVVGVSVIGLALVMPRGPDIGLHGWLGYTVLVGMVFQVLLGIFRGTKGGPTAPAKDGTWRGDHYDMTPLRRAFELLHKGLGYSVLALAVVVIVLGLWKANAPVWMWAVLGIWWPSLIVAFVVLQRRGMAIDTYQAIWGDDPAHPGNRMAHPGWGVRRTGAQTSPEQKTKGDHDVRRDRGDGVRSH